MPSAGAVESSVGVPITSSPNGPTVPTVSADHYHSHLSHVQSIGAYPTYSTLHSSQNPVSLNSTGEHDSSAGSGTHAATYAQGTYTVHPTEIASHSAPYASHIAPTFIYSHETAQDHHLQQPHHETLDLNLAPWAPYSWANPASNPLSAQTY